MHVAGVGMEECRDWAGIRFGAVVVCLQLDGHMTDAEPAERLLNGLQYTGVGREFRHHRTGAPPRQFVMAGPAFGGGSRGRFKTRACTRPTTHPAPPAYAYRLPLRLHPHSHRLRMAEQPLRLRQRDDPAGVVPQPVPGVVDQALPSDKVVHPQR